MIGSRTLGTFVLVIVALLAFGAPAFAQLDRAFEAHGGLAKWKGYGSVEFDLSWAGAKGTKKDHQLVDLRSRDGFQRALEREGAGPSEIRQPADAVVAPMK